MFRAIDATFYDFVAYVAIRKYADFAARNTSGGSNRDQRSKCALEASQSSGGARMERDWSGPLQSN